MGEINPAELRKLAEEAQVLWHELPGMLREESAAAAMLRRVSEFEKLQAAGKLVQAAKKGEALAREADGMVSRLRQRAEKLEGEALIASNAGKAGQAKALGRQADNIRIMLARNVGQTAAAEVREALHPGESVRIGTSTAGVEWVSYRQGRPMDEWGREIQEMRTKLHFQGGTIPGDMPRMESPSSSLALAQEWAAEHPNQQTSNPYLQQLGKVPSPGESMAAWQARTGRPQLGAPFIGPPAPASVGWKVPGSTQVIPWSSVPWTSETTSYGGSLLRAKYGNYELLVEKTAEGDVLWELHTPQRRIDRGVAGNVEEAKAIAEYAAKLQPAPAVVAPYKPRVGDVVEFEGTYGPGTPRRTMRGTIIDVGSGAYPRNPTVMVPEGQVEVLATNLRPVAPQAAAPALDWRGSPLRSGHSSASTPEFIITTDREPEGWHWIVTGRGKSGIAREGWASSEAASWIEAEDALRRVAPQAAATDPTLIKVQETLRQVEQDAASGKYTLSQLGHQAEAKLGQFDSIAAERVGAGRAFLTGLPIDVLRELDGIYLRAGGVLTPPGRRIAAEIKSVLDARIAVAPQAAAPSRYERALAGDESAVSEMSEAEARDARERLYREPIGPRSASSQGRMLYRLGERLGEIPKLSEPLKAAMREVRANSDRYLAKERGLNAPYGSIAAGAGQFDEFVQGEALAVLLREVGKGKTIAEAEAAAKAWARDAVKIHNAKRPKDVTWQRWEGTADSTIETAGSTLKRAGEPPPAAGGSRVGELIVPYQTTPGVQLTEEADLARRAQAGDRAATDELVMKVKNLVVSMANDMKRPGVEMDDLIQEGMIGALEAVKGFDPTKGKWSSWAAIWIKGRMRSARGLSRVVPIPTHKRTLVRRFWATIEELHVAYGAHPAMEEVRQKMGLSAEAFDNLLSAATGPASKPLGGELAASFAPAPVDVRGFTASAEAKSEEAIRAGLNALLTPREAEVFWMSAFEGMSTTQIAMKFNSRHAAIKRNIEVALQKLREAFKSGKLGQSWHEMMVLALFAAGIVGFASAGEPAAAAELSPTEAAVMKASQTPPLQVRRTKIIGTDLVYYSAWEPTTTTAGPYHGHSTVTYSGPETLGKAGTEVLPPELDALPPMSTERADAVHAWQAEKYQRAYDAIYAAHPELKGTSHESMGEVMTTEPGTK